ncbi:hypothetical protein SSBR45G_16710 [Bradyrhizobium sp. SSBR45G]|nr:hypothetical protein SSBR45G_16710 [Bradyrhizobium sp. SSBR45G]GLH83521.1 hypothetical protein SSBR45R_09810 [Bradyrhizobium sp. SSBR45R]
MFLPGAVLLRTCIALIALSAVAWGIRCLPVFQDQSRLEAAKDLILRNVKVSDADLDALAPLLQRASDRIDCVPVVDRSVAIIRLRLAENALSSATDTLDRRLSELDQAIRKSLGCAPTDSYLWLVLFWVRNNREGLRDDHYDLLRMSYRLGPNEGWIAVKRNAMALAMFEGLPPDLADAAIAEFARLVKSELYTEAIDLLKGPGWRLRDRLMAGLAGVPERNVGILVKAMSDIGYDLDSRAPVERRNRRRI